MVEGRVFFVLLSCLAERAFAAFPLREVRHGGRARVFSCFCRVWRSGLKNRPPGTEGARHAHRRTLATTNAELRTTTSSAITHSPPPPRRARKVRHAHRRTLATTNAELRTTTSSAITLSPTAPPGTEGAPTRTGARLLQPMPNLERQPARQSRPPPLPRRARKVRHAHRRTLATTNAELGTTTSSAITPSHTAPPGTEGAPTRTGARLLR